MAVAIIADTGHRRLGDILLASFRATYCALVAVAESGPRMAQLDRLSETSDEQLAAKGLTRAGEVKRIFGGSIYL